MSESKKTTGKGSQKKSKTQKKKKSAKTRLHAVPKRSGPTVEFMDVPSLGDIQAPTGFRVVSYSQAMMEYAGPVLEASKSQNINDLNERMQIARVATIIERRSNRGLPEKVETTSEKMPKAGRIRM